MEKEKETQLSAYDFVIKGKEPPKEVVESTDDRVKELKKKKETSRDKD